MKSKIKVEILAALLIETKIIQSQLEETGEWGFS